MALDLCFSEEQDMLRDMVRGICEQYSPISVVRENEDAEPGYPAELWKQLAAVDLLGLMLPEEYGGSGQSLIEGVVVYEELGRALAPSPHFVSCVMSAGAITRNGSDDQKSEWLPRIASGDAILTPAWLEPSNGFGPKGVQVRAEPSGDGFVITGAKRHVYFASSASQLVVLARTGDDDNDVDLFLVDPSAPGVTLTNQKSISSDNQARVDFDKVPAIRIGDASTGWAAWDDTMHDGMVLLAAAAVGGSRYALDITIEYSKERKQFDKALAEFQALSHYMADAATALDGAEILVHQAAWARSNGKADAARIAPMAKLFACNTYRDLTAMSQQVFGGIGFTVEYEIQLYFRRAKQLQISWYDSRYLEDLVSAQVLDGEVVRPRH